MRLGGFAVPQLRDSLSESMSESLDMPFEGFALPAAGSSLGGLGTTSLLKGGGSYW